MANGDITYVINVNSSNAVNGIEQVSKSMSHMQQAGYRLMQTGAVISASITAPLLKAAQAGLNFDSIMEQANVNFGTMIGNAVTANKLVTDLTQLALNTPLDVSGVQTASQTLLAFGLSSEKVIPTIQMLGDISLGNKDRFDKLSLAFAQMTAAGKLMGNDLLQMINAGFNPLLVISEKTGLSMQELRKIAETTGISSQTITAAFQMATQEGGKFFEGMKNATSTYEGQMTKLKEQISITFGIVMKPLFDELRLKILPSLVQWLKNLQDKFEQMNPKAQKTVLIMGLLLAGIGPLLIVIGGLTFAFNTIALAISALSSPIWLIIAAIAALVGAFIYLYNSNEEVAKAMDSAWRFLSQTIPYNIAIIRQAVQDLDNDLYEASMRGISSFMRSVEDGFTKFAKFMRNNELMQKWFNPEGKNTDKPGFYEGQIYGISEDEVEAAINKYKNSKPKITLPTLDPYATISGDIGDIFSGTDEVINKLKNGVLSVEDLSNAFKDLGNNGDQTLKKLTESVKSMTQAVEQQTKSFTNFSGLFEIFEREPISITRLMNRLKAHLRDMKEWASSLAELEQKGISDVFLNELRGLGPQSVDMVNALNRMTKEQLQSYSAGIDSIYQIAGGQSSAYKAYENKVQNTIEKQVNLYMNNTKITNEDALVDSIVKILRKKGVRI